MLTNIKKYLLSTGSIMIIIGVILQVLAFIVTKDSTISLISGIAGVFSVVLCSERKISMYTFGFIQLLTYIILCIYQNFYGELIENAFYFITMIIGLILWKRNYNNDTEEVETKSLSKEALIGIIIGGILLAMILGKVLSFTDDTQPYLDIFSTVPAFIAQILMILRYKEQWYFWLVVDVLTCILWIRADSWCMVVQYIFWTANCIYGLKRWKQ